ncbi:hypothetical protein BU26DRAFT_158486 [Trematosphaeria pertusa]|uniref:Uncharacterized protein n=1 Tax=Trematosphaeria pertusa TaxID=390896 RepID=A0A6A6HW33_9PLEO|nr:uncharacterized protein BU26DRAFT_158486 [Trematosphaeria pertusa]KAF2242286.1 hypothetical protein BU26DRAFT_158486 [Trematosphaeria pertusa]
MRDWSGTLRFLDGVLLAENDVEPMTLPERLNAQKLSSQSSHQQFSGNNDASGATVSLRRVNAVGSLTDSLPFSDTAQWLPITTTTTTSRPSAHHNHLSTVTHPRMHAKAHLTFTSTCKLLHMSHLVLHSSRRTAEGAAPRQGTADIAIATWSAARNDAQLSCQSDSGTRGLRLDAGRRARAKTREQKKTTNKHRCNTARRVGLLLAVSRRLPDWVILMRDVGRLATTSFQSF